MDCLRVVVIIAVVEAMLFLVAQWIDQIITTCALCYGMGW